MIEHFHLITRITVGALILIFGLVFASFGKSWQKLISAVTIIVNK
jgi:hypothetical protein